MRTRVALAGTLAALLTIGNTGAVSADHGAEGEPFEEDVSYEEFGPSACFGRAAKVTVDGRAVGETVERHDGTVVFEATFTGTYSWVVLDHETGEPDGGSEENGTVELAGRFKDVYENNEQNEAGDYIGPVTGRFSFKGEGTSAGGLKLKVSGKDVRKYGEGGFEGKTRRYAEVADCTAE